MLMQGFYVDETVQNDKCDTHWIHKGKAVAMTESPHIQRFPWDESSVTQSSLSQKCGAFSFSNGCNDQNDIKSG